jgi:hypothetical protein
MEHVHAALHMHALCMHVRSCCLQLQPSIVCLITASCGQVQQLQSIIRANLRRPCDAAPSVLTTLLLACMLSTCLCQVTDNVGGFCAAGRPQRTA